VGYFLWGGWFPGLRGVTGDGPSEPRHPGDYSVGLGSTRGKKASYLCEFPNKIRPVGFRNLETRLQDGNH